MAAVPQNINKHARSREISRSRVAASALLRISHLIIEYSPIIKLTVAKRIGVDKYKWHFNVFHELSNDIKDLKKYESVRCGETQGRELHASPMALLSSF